MKVVQWHPEDEDAEARLAEVLQRHKESKSTLGPMPDAAFRDRARNHGLVLGLIEGHVAAYILYDLPRHHTIKLVHLCIGAEYRGAGLARQLLNFVIERNPGRAAVVAACRKDYKLDGFWRSLGMRPSAEKPGRALGGSTLVMWIRRVGALDIFEDADLNSGLPLAVLDSNVVSGLYGSDPQERENREATALENDWVRSSVTFVISEEVDYDLSQIANDRERKHQMAAISSLTRLRSARPDDRRLEAKLLSQIGAADLHRDRSLIDDVKQLADAIHGGADYFVTNDENLIGLTKDWLSAEYQLQIVRPYELVLALRPESENAGFESKLMDEFDLVWRNAANVGDSELELAFLDYSSREKPKAFRRKLRSASATAATAEVQVLFDKADRSWALVGLQVREGKLAITLLRVVRGSRGATVAFQLLRHLRRRAAALGLERVAIEDPCLSPTIRAAMEHDGFTGDPPMARLVAGSQTLREFMESDLATNMPTDPQFVVTTAERRYWPLRLRVTPLPTYIVPIHPHHAERLFGFSEAMWALRRPRGLGLSREHVYFCSPRAPLTATPGRILWYVTADDSAEVRQLGVRSTVTGSSVMKATLAHARYGHLGVLGKAEINAASDARGMVRVVRFQETEKLEVPLPRRTLFPLLRHHNVTTKLYTARRADPKLFDEVMAMQASERERRA